VKMPLFRLILTEAPNQTLPRVEALSSDLASVDASLLSQDIGLPATRLVWQFNLLFCQAGGVSKVTLLALFLLTIHI